jgi:hypothetical protein
MRQLAPVCVLLLSLGACASQAELSSHPQVNADAIDHREKTGLQGAVESPLADVNLVRTQIPPVLLWAEQNPYQRPAATDCAHIAVEVQDLDDALGDDFDIHESEDPFEKRGRVAEETVISVARDVEDDFIPFRSWVRRLSGAQKHDNAVRIAVYAGRVRRSYLKGVGLALGCAYPAAPRGAQPLRLSSPPAPPETPQPVSQASSSRLR